MHHIINMSFLYKLLFLSLLGIVLVFFPISSSAELSTDTVNPVCPINITPAGPPWFANQAITINNGSITDDLAGVKNIKLEQTSGPTITTLPKTYDGSTFSFSWTPTDPNTTYVFRITATDNAGNVNSLCPVQSIAISPNVSTWIQITGDIHSNGNISIPGGPQ